MSNKERSLEHAAYRAAHKLAMAEGLGGEEAHRRGVEAQTEKENEHRANKTSRRSHQ